MCKKNRFLYLKTDIAHINKIEIASHMVERMRWNMRDIQYIVKIYKNGKQLLITFQSNHSHYLMCL